MSLPRPLSDQVFPFPVLEAYLENCPQQSGTANGKIGYLFVEPGAAALPHMNAGRGQAQFLPGRLTASHRLIVIAAVYA